MIELRLLLVPSPLALLSACGAPCEGPEMVSNTVWGIYAYTGPDQAAVSSAPRRGAIGPTNLPVISLTGGASGSFNDAEGYGHTFTMVIDEAASGATAVLANTSVLREEQRDCLILSGSLALTTFTTDCHSASSCVGSVSGALSAAGQSSAERFAIDLTLDATSAWQSVSCPQAAGNTRFEGS